MDENRPNPDDLLARVQTEETAERRGKLKIYFGYAAGVGKTYAMLEAAHRAKAEGVDVVVGYVEPHGRPATEALLHGLEVLPPRLIPYRGMTLREFDLDGALARRPQRILVDELAHTNAEGSRHAKRWQDVEELLAAGIDVDTTLNVQHVESLNDVIAQITGVVVRETLPDSVIEKADEVELVDLTPEDLMDRLREGHVYLPQQAERALHSFFRKANLTALRELSLRQVAQRLSRDVQAARQETAAKTPWATSERLLVCVGPSPTSARLIRTARRMAAAFGAEWLAVAVEPRGSRASQAAAREQIARHLRLAERLGAETHVLVGDDAAQTLLDLAIARNVTKIVVGKSSQPRWRRLLFGTLVDSLLERSGDIDVYVIRGASEGRPATRPPPEQQPIHWSRYLGAAAVVVLSALVGWGSAALHLSEANIVMVFLLGVAIVATWFGRGPAVAAAIASVLVFDFFFVPPHLTLSVADTEYIITFLVMLLIGMIVSALTARIHEQLQAVRRLQRRTAALFRLTTQLSEVAGWEFLIHAAGKQLREIFDGEVVIYVREKDGSLRLRFGEETSLAQSDANAAVAHWVADHDQVAGLGTDTLPNAAARFVPLVGSQRTIGAVGVRSSDLGRFSDPDQGRLLETCASLIALSLERDQSVLEASEARVRAETEEMRNTLLSSVSHDLRTPLAAIAAASASLLDRGAAGDESHRRELLHTIAEESHRLTRLVENLLEITRLESGSVEPNKQWHVLEEVVGSALARVQGELGRRRVHVEIPPDLPLLHLDGVLMEQVFVNLFENAARYAPAGGPIDVIARRRNAKVEIVIADRGPGLPPGSEARLMEKFYRAPASSADGRRGVGLGLAICRAVLQLHGGRISARNRAGGGAEFILELPVDPAAPSAMPDEAAAPSES